MSAPRHRTRRKPASSPGSSSASRRTSKPSTGIERVLLRASALLKREFDRSRAIIEKLRGAGGEAFDDLWEEVDRVRSHQPPLWVGGGYRSFAAFIAGELPGETARSVNRNVLVARSFTPADETP
jgi:hypothetical protein